VTPVDAIKITAPMTAVVKVRKRNIIAPYGWVVG